MKTDDTIQLTMASRASVLATAPGVSGAAGDAGGPGSTGGQALRDAVRNAARALDRARAAAADEQIGGGELGALVDLVGALDAGHAAAVALTDRVERGVIAERAAGLPLEGVLALSTRSTFGDRRALLRIADALRRLPNVRRAFLDGRIGWAETRAIVAEVSVLDADGRDRFDQAFATDRERLARMGPDELLDAVRDAVARLRPDLTRERAVTEVERRFLSIQPALDGSLTGYFELDPEAGATLLAALESAAPPPTAGRRDVSTDALDEPPEDAATGVLADAVDAPACTGVGPLSGAAPDGASDDSAGGAPGAVSDLASVGAPPPGGDGPRVGGRSRGRQRADALVTLAEVFLAGGRADGTFRRARPRMDVVCDIRTLVGDDEVAAAARLLWRTIGSPPILTAEAARRLASDADLRFLLVDGGEVLGISRPTSSIPATVRAAVHARDRGCRFPGCRMPAAWTDLHHVIAREQGGPTEVANLVALCRRHHMAVTDGRWRLAMTPDGAVTVRRGRRSATSDPPGQHAITLARSGRHRRPPGSPPPKASSARTVPTAPTPGGDPTSRANRC